MKFKSSTNLSISQILLLIELIYIKLDLYKMDFPNLSPTTHLLLIVTKCLLSQIDCLYALMRSFPLAKL